MKTFHKGTCSKIFDLFCTVRESSNNIIDIPLLHIGCSSCVLIKDLFLDVTHKQAGTVRPKSTPHSEPSGLAVLILSIERESIQSTSVCPWLKRLV